MLHFNNTHYILAIPHNKDMIIKIISFIIYLKLIFIILSLFTVKNHGY